MTHQIMPQRDAFICIIPKNLNRCISLENAADERARLEAWREDWAQ